MIYVNGVAHGSKYKQGYQDKLEQNLKKHQNLVKQADLMLENGEIDKVDYDEIIAAIAENYENT